MSRKSESDIVKGLNRRIEWIGKALEKKGITKESETWYKSERMCLRYSVVRIKQMKIVMDHLREVHGIGSEELKSVVEKLWQVEINHFGSIGEGLNPIWWQYKRVLEGQESGECSNQEKI